MQMYMQMYIHTYIDIYIYTYKKVGTYMLSGHCPPQAGRGQPKRPQAPLHRGGRGRGQTRPDGESNKAKQDNYPLDRQRGIPWGGAEGGCGSPASYALGSRAIYIYIYVYTCTYTCSSLACLDSKLYFRHVFCSAPFYKWPSQMT